MVDSRSSTPPLWGNSWKDEDSSICERMSKSYRELPKIAKIIAAVALVYAVAAVGIYLLNQHYPFITKHIGNSPITGEMVLVAGSTLPIGVLLGMCLCKSHFYPSRKDASIKECDDKEYWGSVGPIMVPAVLSTPDPQVMVMADDDDPRFEQEMDAMLSSPIFQATDLEREKCFHFSPIVGNVHHIFNGVPLLHLAVYKNDFALVRFLLDKGANINLVDRHGNSVLCRAQSPAMVNLLMDTPRFDFSEAKNKKGENPVTAAYRLCSDRVKEEIGKHMSPGGEE